MLLNYKGKRYLELLRTQTDAMPSEWEYPRVTLSWHARTHKAKNLPDAAAPAAYLSSWVTWGQEDCIFAASLRNLVNFRPSWG